MAFTASAIFREWLNQAYQVSGTGYTGLDSDTVKVALYGNTGTPDKDAAVASTGYNTGQWVTGNELSGTNWAAGGIALTSKTFTTPATGVFMFDAADTPSAGNTTLTAVFGCLVYDDTITAGTVADQGVSFHYFGGTQSVTAGLFTVVWAATGINRWTV